jgi:hypothetical protein
MATNAGKMNVKAAARVYSATAKNGNGGVAKGTFGARAMSSAMRPQAQPGIKDSNSQTPRSKA